MADRGGGEDAGPGKGSCPALIGPTLYSDYDCIGPRVPTKGRRGCNPSKKLLQWNPCDNPGIPLNAGLLELDIPWDPHKYGFGTPCDAFVIPNAPNKFGPTSCR